MVEINDLFDIDIYLIIDNIYIDNEIIESLDISLVQFLLSIECLQLKRIINSILKRNCYSLYSVFYRYFLSIDNEIDKNNFLTKINQLDFNLLGIIK